MSDVNRKRCPRCDSFDTDSVHTERLRDAVEVTRVCNDCPAQFVNRFGLFAQELQQVEA